MRRGAVLQQVENRVLSNYSAGYKRTVLLLLTVAYAFNAMDRGIISIIGQAMKEDLGLTDTQFGLLSGTAFAALYAFGGIPIARLAERFNRVNIIAIAMVAWSSLTTLCGLAANFTQLLVSRAGVGVAESGCTPAAHSLISDYFEPGRRTSALSVYSAGISVGYVVAALVGGYVAQHYGWRAACAIVGLPGVMLAIVLKLVVREPARSGAGLDGSMRAGGPGLVEVRDSATSVGAHAEVSVPATGRAGMDGTPDGGACPPRRSLAGEFGEMVAVARTLVGNRRAFHMILGVTIGGFANYGFYGFAPLYFNRAFGLSYATTGVIAALTGGIAVGVGIVAGGFVTDRFGLRRPEAYALVPAVGTLLATPFYLLAAVSSEWHLATAFLAVAGFLQYTSLGPTFGVVQNAVEPRRRATATALLYVFLNVVALGGGPLFTGWVIDRSGALGASLPDATRHGLMVLVVFYAWACAHYFRASSVQSDSM
jgi:MFS family permease